LSDVGASLDGFSQLNARFSSEAGAVLTFFGYFFVSRQKSNWGLGQSTIKNIVRSFCGYFFALAGVISSLDGNSSGGLYYFLDYVGKR